LRAFASPPMANPFWSVPTVAFFGPPAAAKSSRGLESDRKGGRHSCLPENEPPNSPRRRPRPTFHRRSLSAASLLGCRLSQVVLRRRNLGVTRDDSGPTSCRHPGLS